MSARACLRGPVVTVVALACALFAGVAATGAATASAASESECGLALLKSFTGGPPVPASQPLDPVISGIYAVLRRPSGPQDALQAINPLGEDLSSELRAYFPDSIRQLAIDPSGERWFLVAGFARGIPIPPARCLPKPLRRQRGRLVAEQRRREQVVTYCVDDVGPRRPEEGTTNCQPFETIQTGGGLDTQLISQAETVDLVPDGVAALRIAYHNGSVYTAEVRENAFVFASPPPLVALFRTELRRIVESALAPGARHQTAARRRARARRFAVRLRRLLVRVTPTVQWLDPAGGVIRTFPAQVGNAGEGGASAGAAAQSGA
jgi:hypothetical protein